MVLRFGDQVADPKPPTARMAQLLERWGASYLARGGEVSRQVASPEAELRPNPWRLRMAGGQSEGAGLAVRADHLDHGT